VDKSVEKIVDEGPSRTTVPVIGFPDRSGSVPRSRDGTRVVTRGTVARVDGDRAVRFLQPARRAAVTKYEERACRSMLSAVGR
jgi:hypothetical protein